MLLRQHAALSSFVAPSLQHGEEIEAILSSAETGSPLEVGSLAKTGTSASRTCAVILTNRRLLVVGQSPGPGSSPHAHYRQYPRSAIKVGNFSKGNSSATLHLAIADHEAVDLTVQRAWRGQAQQLAQMLGWHA